MRLGSQPTCAHNRRDRMPRQHTAKAADNYRSPSRGLQVLPDRDVDDVDRRGWKQPQATTVVQAPARRTGIGGGSCGAHAGCSAGGKVRHPASAVCCRHHGLPHEPPAGGRKPRSDRLPRAMLAQAAASATGGRARRQEASCCAERRAVEGSDSRAVSTSLLPRAAKPAQPHHCQLAGKCPPAAEMRVSE